jgi:hypothetical protein
MTPAFLIQLLPEHTHYAMSKMSNKPAYKELIAFDVLHKGTGFPSEEQGQALTWYLNTDTRT